MGKWWDKIKKSTPKKQSFIRQVVAGSLYRASDIRSGTTAFSDIKTQIDVMRAMTRDAQIATALSYYATDCTTANSSGKIIWATPKDKDHAEAAEIVNKLFDKWEVNRYVRDHILELATIGNLYIPTTDLYHDVPSNSRNNVNVALDFNTMKDSSFEIVPSTKIPPDEIIHLWYHGKPQGYIYKPDDQDSGYTIFPETAVIHFSLGGLLGNYSIEARTADGEDKVYDIQFAQPMFEDCVQPTQTLSLLEDATVLSSLVRIVKFINVDCGNAEEEEIIDALQQIKDSVEQQLSLHTGSGDAQSFVNPQSPSNLIYLPKINGNDAVTVTDLKMTDHEEGDNKLLEYFQNKKLSVLGVPKEMMNFSSNEGLGGAGTVASQRSAIYANGLQRLSNAYIEGWKNAFNIYFASKQMSGFIDTFELHMNPIITPLSTVATERRDSAMSQAQAFYDLLNNLGVAKDNTYLKGIQEILIEAFPTMATDIMNWKIDLNAGGEDNGI